MNRGLPTWLLLALHVVATGAMFWCLDELPAAWARAGFIACVAVLVALPHLPRRQRARAPTDIGD